MNACSKNIRLTFVCILLLRNEQSNKRRKNISVTLANAAKDKNFQDKGNEEVVAKLREFGVQSFASKRNAGGKKVGKPKEIASPLSSVSSEYSSEDEFDKELERRRRWTRRQRIRSRKSISRGRYCDEISISTITGLPRDCSPPVRCNDKSDSFGTYVSDRE